MKETTNGGAFGSLRGLGAKQQLQIRNMIEKDLEKSENRVLAAIADLRSEVKTEIQAVNGRITVQTWSIVGWVTIMLIWIFERSV